MGAAGGVPTGPAATCVGLVGAGWRRQAVASALSSRGVAVGSADEADVLVVLRGAREPQTAQQSASGRSLEVLVEPGGHGRRGCRALPADLGADELVRLLERPHLLPRPRQCDDATTPAPRLSPREGQVLACLAEGLGNAGIAERLCVSPHTARTHVQNVLAKLKAPSRAVAVARAHQLALL